VVDADDSLAESVMASRLSFAVSIYFPHFRFAASLPAEKYPNLNSIGGRQIALVFGIVLPQDCDDGASIDVGGPIQRRD